MKKINQPRHDDANCIRSIATSCREAVRPELQLHLQSILDQYDQYSLYQGNPWDLTPLNIPDILKSYLRNRYASPPNSLDDTLTNIRHTLSPDVCPMCGSLGTHSADHFLPKEDWPEYSLFVANLVPACACNPKRGRNHKGDSAPVRALHPYYDTLLLQRLARASMHGPLPAPKFGIEAIPLGNADDARVNYHVASIIRRTGVTSWFEKTWAGLLERPRMYIPTLPNAVGDPDIVRHAIENLRNTYDQKLGTPNNWESMFYSGLLERGDVPTLIFYRL